MRLATPRMVELTLFDVTVTDEDSARADWKTRKASPRRYACGVCCNESMLFKLCN